MAEGKLSNINWDKTLDQIIDVLKEEFGSKIKLESEEALTKLKVIAGDIAKYWQLALGDTIDAAVAKENLDWIKSEMRILWAKYALNNTYAAKNAAMKVLDVIANLGIKVIRALVIGG